MRSSLATVVEIKNNSGMILASSNFFIQFFPYALHAFTL